MITRLQEQNIHKSADIGIIGAGPVGLWTAIQLKIRNPNANIVVFEQHADYKRKHVLIINPDSLKGIPDHPELKAFVQMVKKTNKLSTVVIENSLKKIAEDVGVNIIHKKITNPMNLKKTLPNVKIVIGSDGAHSITRNTVFEGKEKERKTLTYLAEVKYMVDGKARPQFKLVHSALRSTAHDYVTEHVGSPNGKGKSPVTLRMVISKEEFDTLRKSGKGTFAKPLHITKDAKNIPDRISTLVKRWLSTKQDLFKEKASETSLTTTNLDYYVSEKVVKEKENIQFVLLGDSAFGVPFFRSLNNGLLCGTTFAKEVANNLDTLDVPLKNYENYVEKLSSREVFRAKVKAFALRCFSTLIYYTSQILPERFKLKLIAFYVKIHNSFESTRESVKTKVNLVKTKVNLVKTKASISADDCYTRSTGT